MLQLIAPILSMNGLLLGVVLSVVWLVHRTRQQARRDERAMSESACAAKVEMLLRGMSR